jgi:segregation and condensation protein A
MTDGIVAVDGNRADTQKFHLKDFDGPLDLLLFLIRKNEINIYDIPVSVITSQYLEYLKYATTVDLDNLTDFYEMAATLLYIKSKMLLPVEVNLEDEIEDPRRQLVDTLIEYQKFKKLSDLMEEKGMEAEWIIERKKLQRPLPFPDDEVLWEQIDVWDLLKTFSTVMTSLSSERIIDLYEEVSINEKIALIDELLGKGDDFFFSDLIVNRGSVMEVVCAFLAVLECVKERMIRILQNKLFGDIRIRTFESKVEHGS